MTYELSRREWIRLVGVATAAGFTKSTLSAPRTSSCIVRPSQTEGPYFLDEQLNRSDIRSDPANGSISEGAPLQLTFQISQLDGSACTPLAGAIVDIWQCNARGEYSGFEDFGGHFDTRTQAFLRGYQATDAAGTARFTTIFPGWYPGRAVHIHFKVRTGPQGGRQSEFTSQLYFDEAIIDKVHARPPYASKGQQRAANEEDRIFRRGGRELILPVSEARGEYAGTFELALMQL